METKCYHVCHYMIFGAHFMIDLFNIDHYDVVTFSGFNCVFICYFRLINVEDELRTEQEDMQKNVANKQKVIEEQELRIQSLDNANNKLMVALNQLKEHYNTTAKNGVGAPLRTKISTDSAIFKTSSCWNIQISKHLNEDHRTDNVHSFDRSC